MAPAQVEFKAGRMTMEGNRVVADTRKGIVKLLRSEVDSLVHFQWLDRLDPDKEPEVDQIVFTEEAVFEKVAQSPGRVYLLRFQYDDRKFFFWMQEPVAEEDEQRCAQVNTMLNTPLEEEEEEEEEEDVVAEEPEVDMELGAPVVCAEPVQLIDLQRILSNLSQQAGVSGGHGQLVQDSGPGFSEILRPEAVLPLLEQRVVEERLAPFLPEGMRTLESIAELIPSPQFQQQLDAFTVAVRSGLIDLTQFGIDPSTFVHTVAGFLEAIEDHTPASKEPQDPKDGEMKDG